jgi:hypothetical protein
MSKFRSIKHIVRSTIILALVCYFGIIAVLSIPFIQKRLSGFTAQELSRIMQTEVRIGNIDLGLLNRVIIQNVYLEDKSGKELLKINRLSAKMELSSLLHGKICISSVQLFGLNAHLNRPTPDSKTNFQFVLDAFASKDTIKKKSTIDLRINSVLIRRGQVYYDLLSEAQTPGRFNSNHLGIQNLSAILSLKALTPDSLNAQIKRISFNEQSGFKLKKLALKITANHHGLQANNIEVSFPNSELNIDTLAATYDSASSAPVINNDTRYMAHMRARITLADFAMFVPALAHFNETINLRMSLDGKGYQTKCTDIYISNNTQSLLLKAEAMINHWNEKNNMFLFGNLSQLEVDKEGINWLLYNLSGKNNVPDILKRIGDISFNGDISGYLNQLTTHGTLLTDVGSIRTNVTMHSDTLTHLRSYSGKIISPELQLGTLLNQEKTLGSTTFDIELQGFKYHDGKAESYIKGVISSFTYKQYEYRNIMLDGQYTPGGFNGKLSLDDSNANIEINGHVATRQAVPDFNLKAVVRNFHPNDLNLTDQYKDTDMSLNLTADFNGHSIDDMQGKISIDSVLVNAPEKDQCYFLKNLSIFAGNVSNSQEKQIEIRSPFLNGFVKGNYSYRTLPASILKTLQRYIPSLLVLNKELPETNNDFQFNFQLEDTELFSKVFKIPVELYMPATLNGYFDDNRTRLQIRGYLPAFVYNDSYFESGTLLCNNTSDELQCQVRINKRLQKGAMINLAVNSRVSDDKLKTTIHWGNNVPSTFSGMVEAITSFRKSEESNRLSTMIDLRPSKIILNDTIWKIHPSQITIDKNLIEIDNFLFEHQNQYVRANGRIGKETTDSCLVDLSNIDLQYVMDIIQFHAVKFNGLVTGRVHLHNVLDNPVMYTRLNVKDFSLNDALLGQGDIRGEWDNELGGVRLHADIKENDHYFTNVTGYVSPKEKGLNLNIQAGGTNLSFLQPFVENIFTNMQGRVFGRVRLYGPFSGLDLEGCAQADASMKVNILNTSFTAHADSFRISSGHFAFDNIQVTDPEGHTGLVNGALRHTKLKNLMYDFRFNTNNMLVYHTEKETPEFPFYGKIYTTGEVLLRGGNNTLTVDGTLRTDPQTKFTYVTATAAEATNTQFIKFVDKTPRRQQENIQTELYHHLNKTDNKEEEDTPTDTHINLQIEATPAATMRIVMDPIARDNISANGIGNLRINYYNKGDFQIFGNYNIEEGIYKMSMQNVIHKDFILQSGGTVSFNGNPREANLDVQAVYTVNSASLNDLVADASNTKGTVKVNCLLNLRGNLTAPTLKFDLDLPTVSDEDRELVRSLTSTEEQMNTQIIYLLSIGKFYTFDYANNANQSDATSSLAFSTLSGQLNNMLSQVIDSQNWNVGTNLSTGDKGWTDVEAEAILSGRLLNNRLIINGNFGYRDNPMRNTNFVGDFEAMWLLTKNGDFRLKGYNQTNDRYFTKSTLTTQGIGLMYKKDFTNWRELFDWILLKRRSKRNSQ